MTARVVHSVLLLAGFVKLATWLVNIKLKEVKFGIQCTFCNVFEVDLEKNPKIEHSNEEAELGCSYMVTIATIFRNVLIDGGTL